MKMNENEQLQWNYVVIVGARGINRSLIEAIKMIEQVKLFPTIYETYQ